MIIERPRYLNMLISEMDTPRVKVITGIRRCGKSYLLFKLFKEHLIASGVPENNIFEMSFDQYRNRQFRDPAVFYPHVGAFLDATPGRRYVLLDEVQLLDEFAEVLIDLAAFDDVEVYATGSNAHLLSRDVITEFRGRSREIPLAPLSFSEFMSAFDGSVHDGYVEYATYGGLPAVLADTPKPEDKAAYLSDIFNELYIRDIVERNKIRNEADFRELIDVLASSIGSLTSASRLSNTFKSAKQSSLAPETIERYLGYLEDAFIVRRAVRYDVKGRRYIGAPSKVYFADTGLRNARLNFRQMEENHILENVLFNELIARGLTVDVGVVAATEMGDDGRQHRKQLEIDFVCNRGSERYYVQSAYAMPTRQKAQQEMRPLMRVGDSFKKIVVTQEGLTPHYTDDGILMTNVYDFLLDPQSLAW